MGFQALQKFKKNKKRFLIIYVYIYFLLFKKKYSKFKFNEFQNV